MFYILSEEEYKKRVPVSEVEELKNEIEQINRRILDNFRHGICRKEEGGYCDKCPADLIGTCKKSKRYFNPII